MTCSPKTMFKIAALLALLLGGGYFFFPQFRPIVVGLAPFALFALCPLAMVFAAMGMSKDRGGHGGCACGHTNTDSKKGEAK